MVRDVEAINWPFKGYFFFVETAQDNDAAVCLQKYEPWIIEMCKSSITHPSTLRVVGKGSDSTPLTPSGNIQGTPIANTRYLNLTGKGTTLFRAHENAVLEMQDDNDRHGSYAVTTAVGPVAPPHTTFLLTSTYSAGHFSH